MPRIVALMGAALVAAIAGAGASLVFTGASRHETPSRTHERPGSPAPIAPWTLVATVRGPTPGYASPRAATPVVALAPTRADSPAALPVVASSSGWTEVRVASPPTAAQTAWIRSSNVTLSRTPFHIVVDLSRKRLLLFRRGEPVMCAPAGVGTPESPTPVGHYFVVLLARSPEPSYGRFVVVTSAFADTVTDWEEAGAAVVTIEGPLDSTKAIGTTGARITSGSVRLLDPDLDRLRVVPPGSPLDVVSSFQLPPAVGGGCALGPARHTARHGR